MKRTGLNLLIDILAASCFIGMIATGYILHFPLPPGTNKSLALWGLTRHQWGEVHYGISLALLIVLLIHLVLHWQWVVSVVGRQFGSANSGSVRTFRSGMITLLVVSAVVGGFAWLAEVSVKPLLDPCCPSAETAASTAQDPAAGAKVGGVDFRKDVFALLQSDCLRCHGPGRAQGGFRVDRKEDFFIGNGKKALVIPGNSQQSRLLGVVSGLEIKGPLAAIHQLPEREIGILRAWIDAGAEWPDE